MRLIGEKVGGQLARYMYRKMLLPMSSDIRYIGAINEDLQILAVVAYNLWLDDSVFMHVAVEQPRYFRFLIREAFTYAFVTCKKSRVYGLTPITSVEALRLSKRLGFRKVHTTPDFVLQVMDKAECRWIDDSECQSRSGACAVQ